MNIEALDRTVGKAQSSPITATMRAADPGLPYAVLERLAEGLVLVDERGRVTAWNRAMEEISGVSRDLALDRSVWDIHDAHACADPNASGSVKSLVKNLIREAVRDPASPRLRARTEFIWQRPDGERRVLRTDAFAVGQSNRCTIGYVVQDVTDERQAESALRLTQLSVDQAADLIHWITVDGRLLYVSDSNCKRHGYSREELLDMTIFDLDPLLTPAGWDEIWRETRRQGSTILETVHRTKSGETFPIEVVGNYVLHNGCEYNFVYGRDITERKQAEEQLHRAKDSLETSNRELQEAMRLSEEAANRLAQMNERLIQTQEALALQARTDPLTGCLNHGAIMERLDELLAQADRAHYGLGVGMVDIDHFKRINDTYGHQIGDLVLCEVVTRCEEALRPYDVFGRFGGEEFLVLVPDADEETLRVVLERLRTRISRRRVHTKDADITVTVSVGATVGRSESADVLVSRADVALYLAKERGRDRLEMSASAREPVA
jgi:diguanylate cyclase (GGDEF)-like protein/PAS domain S-box-containing protein